MSPSLSFEQLLGRAAALCGIEPGYWDIWGQYHEARAPAIQAMLRAKGWAAGSAEELERSLAAHTRAEWERLAPVTVVVDQNGDSGLPLSLPADYLGRAITVRVRCEDGATSQFHWNAADLPQEASIEFDGRAWVRKRARLPVRLPLGYHEVSVQCGDLSAASHYIVTPERAWTDPLQAHIGRAAGLGISLYGVRSARDWGCGDFHDLRSVIDWAADELHIGFVSLNPLHAIHNRRPFNTSPYLPNCIFYQNFIYLDIEGIEDYARCRRAQRLRQSDAVKREIDELRRAEFVEYERVAALKLRFLKLLFACFLREWRTNSPRSRQFEAFREREGELLRRFATYCALDESLHRCHPDMWMWPQWPPEYRDPASEAAREFSRRRWRSVMFYQYLQWQIDLQLAHAQQHARSRGLSIGLYHDLALATDQFGSDLWAHASFFVSGCRVGAPPDDFSPQGQDWGFPPPNSQRHREDGYKLFAESIRKNCRHGGALRIDHVMRLFRLYWIPEGSDATQGAYVKELTHDFVRILALESVRNQVIVVGEDLGTVEPEIREILARFGILSYRLFYFEKNRDGKFRHSAEYPHQALVSSTTHDLPTIAGFWIGADIEARRRAGMLNDEGYRSQWEMRQSEKQKMLDLLFEQNLLPAHLPRCVSAYPELTGDLHYAVIGFLAQTPSQLLAINQEDLTKETAQQNLPGSTWQYPNWGRKMRFTVEELRTNNDAKNFSAMVRNWIVDTGRENRASN
jgi:4-alpha-glucanotransferase